MRILVTRKLPFWDEESKPLTDAGHQIDIGPLDKLDDRYDALLSLLTDKITPEVLERGKSLKVVANYAVGFDNIDIEACKAGNIAVTNTPSGAVNESVAEMAWALMLALSRRMGEASQFMRNAAYTGWDPGIFMGTDMKGKVLGIIGAGRIGKMVARRAVGFEMRVIEYSRASGLNIEEVLSQSDYVSLHVPLTDQTRHLINGRNLVLFKKGAILVNTARGPVVNEAEVAEALRAGMISGYGADVLENEPHPHPELLQMENVILTPHIASATVAARRDMTRIAVENLMAGLSGQIPPNVVQ